MNKIFEIGRLTRDPEVRYTQSGKAVCIFSIAVDDGYGENQKAYFFPVVVWNKSAEACGNSLHKGSKVAVTGKLTTRQYDNKEGKTVTAFEIVADAFGGVEFLDGKKQGGNQSNEIDETEEIPF